MGEPHPADLIGAIWELREQFLRLGLKPPEAINLEDSREGYAFSCEMRRLNELAFFHPKDRGVSQDGEGRVMDGLTLFGIKVRWPTGLRLKAQGPAA